MDASSENFAETIVNDLSSLVTVDILPNTTSIQYPTTGTNGNILGGGAATAPTAPDFTALYEQTLRKFRDISIIVLPGSSWDGGIGHSNIAATLAHCESIRNRVLILDPPVSTEFENATVVNGLSLPTSTYSVLYYPWVKMSNPLYHPDKAPDAEKTVLIAPSAIAAGMWAKIDGKRGVWKAPAGVETRLTGAAGLEYVVENLEQDQLNPLGVNCIRKLPSYGSVFWGSRSLATRADPEWRYVPVRRTAIYIEESIYNGIQWAVFEPNAHPLWSSLRANIGNFMNGLFRAGAFQGQTAKDSYFVRCGLGDTMTQGDIDAGQVIVMVGFAPLKPAEFVIVRIQQKVGEE
jgi:phage tail sheath protein FI